MSSACRIYLQESRAVARKPRDAAAVLFGLKFADNIHYKLKSSQASKARRQFSKRTGAKQNLTQNGHSRSFKVVDFGTNRKRICDFLLVINSNIGLILPRFRDIEGFLLRRATPPLFHQNFGDVPLGLDCQFCGSEEQRPPKVIIRVINFELVQPICRGTSTSRTDGRTTYDSNTALALCASPGNFFSVFIVTFMHISDFVNR